MQPFADLLRCRNADPEAHSHHRSHSEWNDYLLPYLVIGLSTNYKTIPVVVQYLVGSYGAKDLGAMMALLVLSVIPIIVFYLTCQKYIIEGVVAGAVKG